MSKTSLACLATAVVAFNVQSVSFTDPVDGQFDVGEYLAENAYGFLPVPVLITEPAVGYGGGFIGMFLHESEQQREKRKQLALESIDGGAQLIPPAVTVAGGAATENGTWFAMFGHRRVWKEDSIRYLGGIGYGNVVMNYYFQPANQTISTEIDTTGFGGIQKLQFRVADTPWFVGVQQLYSNAEFALKTDLPLLDGLSRQFISSGLGVNLEYDGLDNFFFPKQGYAANLEYLWFDEAIGSDNDYQTLLAEAKGYFPVNDTWTIAFAAEYNVLTTNERLLPPMLRPDINLRGIPTNRYQGNYTGSAQAQLMWSIDSRWTALFFGGAGVYSDTASQLWDDLQYAYGTGIRYLIARRYGVHSGIDIGFSEEDTAIYFNVGTGL